jgi:putative endonuclease
VVINSRDIGSRAERQAERYLQKKGYQVIERNWTCRWGEIDLICKKDGILVFVEVKYRLSRAYGEPFEAVTGRKRHRLWRAVNLYLSSNGLSNISCRLDIISVYGKSAFKEQELLLRHFKNIAFL